MVFFSVASLGTKAIPNLSTHLLCWVGRGRERIKLKFIPSILFLSPSLALILWIFNPSWCSPSCSRSPFYFLSVPSFFLFPPQPAYLPWVPRSWLLLELRRRNNATLVSRLAERKKPIRTSRQHWFTRKRAHTCTYFLVENTSISDWLNWFIRKHGWGCLQGGQRGAGLCIRLSRERTDSLPD